jgi:hypothetical protein
MAKKLFVFRKKNWTGTQVSSSPSTEKEIIGMIEASSVHEDMFEIFELVPRSIQTVSVRKLV